MIAYTDLGNGGQLGNQLFQYAALMSVALKNNYEWGIPFINEMGSYQHLDLHTRKPIYNSMDLLKAFNLSCKNVIDKNIFKNKFKEKEGWKFDHTIYDISDWTDIEGYFQSELYFKNNFWFHKPEAIRKEFTFKDEILNSCKEQINLWKDERDLVSIHVRRGDTLGHPLILAISGAEYYQKALENFTDKEYKFVVFSDDLVWSKETFGEENDDIVYSEHEDNEIPHIYDLCKMSLCDHFIIAPSSFSWWGAWLSNNTDKKVVRPLQPFPPSEVYDYYPEEWISCKGV